MYDIAPRSRKEALDQFCRLFRNDRAYLGAHLRELNGLWQLHNATLDPWPDALAAMRIGYAIAKGQS